MIFILLIYNILHRQMIINYKQIFGGKINHFFLNLKKNQGAASKLFCPVKDKIILMRLP